MSGLFNEEPTVVVRRDRQQAQPSASKPAEKVYLDLNGADKLLENLELHDSPLLNAASELLSVLVTIARQGSPKNIERFRQQILDGISTFRRRGLYLDYHPSVIDKSCFVLCAAFDEAVLYTKWGQEGRWENYSLLSKVFSQRNGGEAFFVLLDKAREQPSKLVDFLELQYVLMMIGFKGRYRHADENELNEIKAETYSAIRHFRNEKPLLLPTTPELHESKSPSRPLSLTKLFLLMGFILSSAYAASEYWYFNRSEPFVAQLTMLNEVNMDLTNSNRDLVYVSTDDDLGLQSSDASSSDASQTEATTTNTVLKEWELLLASFVKLADAQSLATTLKRSGYDAFVKSTDERVDVLLMAGNDLSEAKKLKNEINVRFSLSATLRRVQK